MKQWAKKQKGFTIVELLIVIVVIAILAAITIVSFNGIQDKAKRTSLMADLANGSKRLKLDQINAGSYPATIAVANGGLGLKPSSNNSYRYSVNNTTSPQTFCLTAQNGNTFYTITQDTVPTEGSCVNVAAGASATSAILTDGNTDTNPYFGVAPGLASVTVTLPSVIDISKVKVWHYYSDSRTYYSTKTEVSQDGVSWTTVFDSTSAGTYTETSSGRTTSFATQPVKYIRDWLNGSTSNTGNHWVEIQAF